MILITYETFFFDLLFLHTQKTTIKTIEMTARAMSATVRLAIPSGESILIFIVLGG